MLPSHTPGGRAVSKPCGEVVAEPELPSAFAEEPRSASIPCLPCLCCGKRAATCPNRGDVAWKKPETHRLCSSQGPL